MLIDELCACGALRSEHEDRYEGGHGACKATNCTKFTWVGFVEREEPDYATMSTQELRDTRDEAQRRFRKIGFRDNLVIAERCRGLLSLT